MVGRWFGAGLRLMAELFTMNPESWQARGLVGWYAGADPSNNAVFYDSSPNAAHGSTYQFHYDLGDWGGRLHTHAYENGVCHVGAYLAPRPPFTITAWFHVTFDRGGGYVHPIIANYWSGGSWCVLYCSLSAPGGDGKVPLNWVNGGCATFPGAIGHNEYTYATGWAHVACRANATNSREMFYNGVKCAGADTTNQTVDYVYHSFGGWPGEVSHILWGHLDDMRIYNRLLNDQEIAEIANWDRAQELYLYPAPPFTPENVGFFMA